MIRPSFFYDSLFIKKGEVFLLVGTGIESTLPTSIIDTISFNFIDTCDYNQNLIKKV